MFSVISVYHEIIFCVNEIKRKNCGKTGCSDRCLWGIVRWYDIMGKCGRKKRF
ncbi:hypothetical protein HMPREF1987_01895 [Peptostreptococcaceae bacterium oral taxon 113 str. W5053]|nr:hypothetical protein HMPREF1987_01895 [Peptostreptococcaceae bacterium oral taxon 113 str. W5053]